MRQRRRHERPGLSGAGRRRPGPHAGVCGCAVDRGDAAVGRDLHALHAAGARVYVEPRRAVLLPPLCGPLDRGRQRRGLSDRCRLCGRQRLHHRPVQRPDEGVRARRRRHPDLRRRERLHARRLHGGAGMRLGTDHAHRRRRGLPWRAGGARVLGRASPRHDRRALRQGGNARRTGRGDSREGRSSAAEGVAAPPQCRQEGHEGGSPQDRTGVRDGARRGGRPRAKPRRVPADT